MERWRTRAIWVVSRADAGYPQRLKKRLGEDAPPVLYGCGDASILDGGGLAVVGSRNGNETLIEYTEDAGRLAATARRAVISGGARGIDQAAMRGAQDAGGIVVGILADGLEKAVVRREHREALMNGRLALICPYDPAAGFNVGHAMQRNKLIYALADTALVVNSDYGKGGTWAGATEQIERLKFVPIYVRADGDVGKGLAELQRLGARPWPNPKTAQELEEILNSPSTPACTAMEQRAKWSGGPRGIRADRRRSGGRGSADGDGTRKPHGPAHSLPADELFAKVTELLERMDGSRTDARVADELQVPRKLADAWLKRFVETKLRKLFERSSTLMTADEVAEELRFPHASGSQLPETPAAMRVWLRRSPGSRPVRYRSTALIGPLFDKRD